MDLERLFDVAVNCEKEAETAKRGAKSVEEIQRCTVDESLNELDRCVFLLKRGLPEQRIATLSVVLPRFLSGLGKRGDAPAAAPSRAADNCCVAPLSTLQGLHLVAATEQTQPPKHSPVPTNPCPSAVDIAAGCAILDKLVPGIHALMTNIDAVSEERAAAGTALAALALCPALPLSGCNTKLWPVLLRSLHQLSQVGSDAATADTFPGVSHALAALLLRNAATASRDSALAPSGKRDGVGDADSLAVYPSGGGSSASASPSASALHPAVILCASRASRDTLTATTSSTIGLAASATTTTSVDLDPRTLIGSSSNCSTTTTQGRSLVGSSTTATLPPQTRNTAGSPAAALLLQLEEAAAAASCLAATVNSHPAHRSAAAVVAATCAMCAWQQCVDASSPGGQALPGSVTATPLSQPPGFDYAIVAEACMAHLHTLCQDVDATVRSTAAHVIAPLLGVLAQLAARVGVGDATVPHSCSEVSGNGIATVTTETARLPINLQHPLGVSTLQCILPRTAVNDHCKAGGLSAQPGGSQSPAVGLGAGLAAAIAALESEVLELADDEDERVVQAAALAAHDVFIAIASASAAVADLGVPCSVNTPFPLASHHPSTFHGAGTVPSRSRGQVSARMFCPCSAADNSTATESRAAETRATARPYWVYPGLRELHLELLQHLTPSAAPPTSTTSGAPSLLSRARLEAVSGSACCDTPRRQSLAVASQYRSSLELLLQVAERIVSSATPLASSLPRPPSSAHSARLHQVLGGMHAVPLQVAPARQPYPAAAPPLANSNNDASAVSDISGAEVERVMSYLACALECNTAARRRLYPPARAAADSSSCDRDARWKGAVSISGTGSAEADAGHLQRTHALLELGLLNPSPTVRAASIRCTPSLLGALLAAMPDQLRNAEVELAGATATSWDGGRAVSCALGAWPDAVSQNSCSAGAAGAFSSCNDRSPRLAGNWNSATARSSTHPGHSAVNSVSAAATAGAGISPGSASGSMGLKLVLPLSPHPGQATGAAGSSPPVTSIGKNSAAAAGYSPRAAAKTISGGVGTAPRSRAPALPPAWTVHPTSPALPTGDLAGPGLGSHPARSQGGGAPPTRTVSHLHLLQPPPHSSRPAGRSVPHSYHAFAGLEDDASSDGEASEAEEQQGGQWRLPSSRTTSRADAVKSYHADAVTSYHEESLDVSYPTLTGTQRDAEPGADEFWPGTAPLPPAMRVATAEDAMSDLQFSAGLLLRAVIQQLQQTSSKKLPRSTVRGLHASVLRLCESDRRSNHEKITDCSAAPPRTMHVAADTTAESLVRSIQLILAVVQAVHLDASPAVRIAAAVVCPSLAMAVGPLPAAALLAVPVLLRALGDSNPAVLAAAVHSAVPALHVILAPRSEASSAVLAACESPLYGRPLHPVQLDAARPLLTRLLAIWSPAAPWRLAAGYLSIAQLAIRSGICQQGLMPQLGEALSTLAHYYVYNAPAQSVRDAAVATLVCLASSGAQPNAPAYLMLHLSSAQNVRDTVTAALVQLQTQLRTAVAAPPAVAISTGGAATARAAEAAAATAGASGGTTSGGNAQLQQLFDSTTVEEIAGRLLQSARVGLSVSAVQSRCSSSTCGADSLTSPPLVTTGADPRVAVLTAPAAAPGGTSCVVVAPSLVATLLYAGSGLPSSSLAGARDTSFPPLVETFQCNKRSGGAAAGAQGILGPGWRRAAGITACLEAARCGAIPPSEVAAGYLHFVLDALSAAEPDAGVRSAAARAIPELRCWFSLPADAAPLVRMWEALQTAAAVASACGDGKINHLREVAKASIATLITIDKAVAAVVGAGRAAKSGLLLVPLAQAAAAASMGQVDSTRVAIGRGSGALTGQPGAAGGTAAKKLNSPSYVGANITPITGSRVQLLQGLSRPTAVGGIASPAPPGAAPGPLQLTGGRTLHSTSSSVQLISSYARPAMPTSLQQQPQQSSPHLHGRTSGIRLGNSTPSQSLQPNGMRREFDEAGSSIGGPGLLRSSTVAEAALLQQQPLSQQLELTPDVHLASTLAASFAYSCCAVLQDVGAARMSGTKGQGTAVTPNSLSLNCIYRELLQDAPSPASADGGVSIEATVLGVFSSSQRAQLAEKITDGALEPLPWPPVGVFGAQTRQQAWPGSHAGPLQPPVPSSSVQQWPSQPSAVPSQTQATAVTHRSESSRSLLARLKQWPAEAVLTGNFASCGQQDGANSEPPLQPLRLGNLLFLGCAAVATAVNQGGAIWSSVGGDATTTSGAAAPYSVACFVLDQTQQLPGDRSAPAGRDRSAAPSTGLEGWPSCSVSGEAPRAHVLGSSTAGLPRIEYAAFGNARDGLGGVSTVAAMVAGGLV